MEPFKCIVDVKHLPTVNNMYLSKRNGGRYLNPDYTAVKSHIQVQLIKLGLPDFISGIDNIGEYVFHLDIVFVYGNRFSTRDCSNSIKLVEDAIVLVTKIDDSLNFKVNSSKLYYDDIVEKPKLERAYITILPKLKKDLLWRHSEWRIKHEQEYKSK